MAGSIPEDLEYTREHEWVRQEGSNVVVGITDHAQRQLGDIVYAELPNVGDRFEREEAFGTLESVKAVAEMYSPVAGEVVEINGSISDSPEDINTDPYGNGWLIKIRLEGSEQLSGLLTPAEYADYSTTSDD